MSEDARLTGVVPSEPVKDHAVVIGLEMWLAYSKDGISWVPLDWARTFLFIPANFNPRLLHIITQECDAVRIGGSDLKLCEYVFRGIQQADQNRLLLILSDDHATRFNELASLSAFHIRVERHIDGKVDSPSIHQFHGCSARVAWFCPGTEETVLRIAEITYETETYKENGKSILHKEKIEERYNEDNVRDNEDGDC